MVSTHRSNLYLAGLIALIGLAIWQFTSYTGEVHPLVGNGGRIEDAPTAQVTGDDSAELRTSATAPSSEPAVPVESELQEERALEPGVVLGTIFDYDGAPVPHARVAFERFGSPGDFAAFQLADREGDFELNVPPGVWTAYFAGRPGSVEPGLIAMGTIEVHERQDAFLDLYLPGERTLTGGFHCADQDMLLLEVELRDLQDPERVVARMMCSTDHTEHAAYLAALDRDDHDVPLPDVAPGVGRFTLDGLPPAHYEIRAYLDIGKKYWVSSTLDLTGADLEFDPVALTEADFLSRRTLEL